MSESSHPDRPEKLRIRKDKPNLGTLPKEVRDRIEDMWRVGRMLSNFPTLKRSSGELRELFNQSIGLALKLIWSTLSGPLEKSEARRYEEQIESLRNRSRERSLDLPEGEIPVNFWVGVTYEHSHRLACEAELFFLHMALECIPDEDQNTLLKDSLIHCLRRLRNTTVHFKKPLAVTQADFQCELVDESGSPSPAYKFLMPESWFLCVETDELMKTQGVKDRPLFEWFKSICEKQPVWFVYQAAVERICSYYDNKGRTSG